MNKTKVEMLRAWATEVLGKNATVTVSFDCMSLDWKAYITCSGLGGVVILDEKHDPELKDFGKMLEELKEALRDKSRADPSLNHQSSP